MLQNYNSNKLKYTAQQHQFCNKITVINSFRKHLHEALDIIRKQSKDNLNNGIISVSVCVYKQF